jgi:hypothetical protein
MEPIIFFPDEQETPLEAYSRFIASPPASFVYLISLSSDDRARRWPRDNYMDDPIGRLVEVLSAHPLDPRFSPGFLIRLNPLHHATDEPLYPAGTVAFGGNFYDLTFSFNLATNDPATIARLTAAIHANLATPAYQQAKTEYEENQKRHQQQAQDRDKMLAEAKRDLDFARQRIANLTGEEVQA